ncbi:MAG TPA: head GIN domain-containing protein [Chitinophagaceae bacterium]|nr:head GIN domain-containing protein [Chitinophagaceae bacterium]
MKRLFTILLLVLPGLLCLAQGEDIINDPMAARRPVPSFHAIEVNAGIDIYLSQGAEDALVLSAANRGERDHIRAEVKDGVLYLTFQGKRNGSAWKNGHLRAYISCRDLSMLKASAGSDVIVKGGLRVDQLELQLSGGSDFVGSVEAEKFFIRQSGGSDVRVKGKVQNLKVEGSGGSDFLGKELEATYAIIEMSGGSDARLSVTKEIYADASGGSDIHYTGNPVIRHKSASGAGKIRANR